MRSGVVLSIVFLSGCNSILGIDPPIGDAGVDARPQEDGGAPEAEAGCVVPDASVCSVFPQCGCTNQTCAIIDSIGTTECVAIGDVPLYRNCTTSVGDCGLGAQCIGGMCKPYCQTDKDCAGPNRACTQITDTGDGAGKPVPGLKVCSSGCDPIDPAAACGPNGTCLPVSKMKAQLIPDCLSVKGNGMGPGACANNVFNCAAGYICLTSGPHTGDCSKFCRMKGHPEDCPMPLVCEVFLPALIYGGIEYGSCN